MKVDFAAVRVGQDMVSGFQGCLKQSLVNAEAESCDTRAAFGGGGVDLEYGTVVEYGRVVLWSLTVLFTGKTQSQGTVEGAALFHAVAVEDESFLLPSWSLLCVAWLFVSSNLVRFGFFGMGLSFGRTVSLRVAWRLIGVAGMGRCSVSSPIGAFA